jgi:hypothetical protein
MPPPLVDTNTLVSLIGLGLMLGVLLLIVWNEYRMWAADHRATRLVQHFLTPTERLQLNRRGYIDVPSRRTPGRFYRVPVEPGMVTIFEPGQPRRLLCLKPQRNIPYPEHVLVHKLLLEGAEADYLAKANCFTVKRPPPP